MLCVATADPTDLDRLDNLERLIEHPIRALLCTRDEIRSALAVNVAPIVEGVQEQGVEPGLARAYHVGVVHIAHVEDVAGVSARRRQRVLKDARVESTTTSKYGRRPASMRPCSTVPSELLTTTSCRPIALKASRPSTTPGMSHRHRRFDSPGVRRTGTSAPVSDSTAS